MPTGDPSFKVCGHLLSDFNFEGYLPFNPLKGDFIIGLTKASTDRRIRWRDSDTINGGIIDFRVMPVFDFRQFQKAKDRNILVFGMIVEDIVIDIKIEGHKKTEHFHLPGVNPDVSVMVSYLNLTSTIFSLSPDFVKKSILIILLKYTVRKLLANSLSTAIFFKIPVFLKKAIAFCCLVVFLVYPSATIGFRIILSSNLLRNPS